MSDAIPVSGNVQIGPDFFQKEIRNYSRWDFAWGREVGQNSLDAGAKNIVISVKMAVGEACRIVWADDGCGMSLDILINKFLTLGESHKRKGATGGFGWAKTLILFAQASYIVTTGDIILKGCGGSYSYTKGNPRVEGCTIDVTIPKAAATMRNHIAEWASWTDFKGASITMNGLSVRTFADHEILGTKDLPFDWATLTMVKVKDGFEPRMMTRINGQMMRGESASRGVKDNIIIDIVGDSTKYFTANRDALEYLYKSQMDKFLEELHRDPRSVVKVDESKDLKMPGKKGTISIGFSDEELAESLKMMMESPSHMTRELKRQASAVHEGFDIFICNETTANIPEKWMPGMMGNHGIKLMNRWTAIIQLVGQVIGFRGSVTPGWCFALDISAMWDDWEKAILLNPVTIDAKTGKMTNRFKLDNAGFADMVISCIHEFTHADGHGYHNDEFIMTCGIYTRKVIMAWSLFKNLRRSI